MHIVLDLQACQSPESRRRGIGRYSLALAKAIAASPRGHEITVLLNTSIPDSIEYLRAHFDGLLPQARLAAWDALAPTAQMNSANTFRRKASELLRLQVLRRLKPDIVHIASVVEGFSDDLVATIPAPGQGYSNAATLYDLIPLAHPDDYLPNPCARQWYMEKIEHLRRADVLLGISRFTCEEASELLSIADDRLVDISGASDAIFRRLDDADGFRQELMAKYSIGRPFLMYAGGFDPRKNIGALVEAFALLPDTVRSTHQLVIVGGAPKPERLALIERMARVGVTADEVIFTGYVPDSDLVRLYNLCALYVFPSLQEGFGLPALEAMSSGAIVIGSNTSSLPEVIGHPEALFDPRNPKAIACKIVQALTDPGFRESLRDHGRKQPLKFSWEISAQRTIEAFEMAVARRPTATSMVVPNCVSRAETIAFLPAPGSNARGRGIGSATVYADRDCEGVTRGHPLSLFATRREHFDRVIIELADHPYCARTLALADHGTTDILLRDESFGHCLHQLAADRLGRDLVVRLLYRSGGYAALGAAIDAEFSVDALATWVSPESLATLGRSQLLADDSAPEGDQHADCQWRDSVRDMAAELNAVAAQAPAMTGDWCAIASSIARNLPRLGKPQWLVDISQLSVSDAGTGIQRVVRHVLDELIKAPPHGYRVEPVYMHEDGTCRYARNYCAQRYFPDETLPADEVIEFSDGDVYLGLDLGAHLVPQYIDLHRALRDRGVRQYFVVYDLLPILRPDCFRPELVPTFLAWYASIAEVADGVLCISRAVADEFKAWLDQARPERLRPLGIGWFHLGADLAPAQDPSSGDALTGTRLAGLVGRPTFLMVGTVEPRKGHAQTLAAFEQLWDQGVEANLLIVGKPGWLVDDLLERLANHSQRGHQLFWFGKADDDLLLEAYRRASALLMASEGEGFGLPLIEAAHYGIPLIARDLPVFREIAGEHAHYFSGYDAGDLADALSAWLSLDERGDAPQPRMMPRQTWNDTAKQLVELVSLEDWTHRWMPGPNRRFPAFDHRFLTQVGHVSRGRMLSGHRAGILLYGPYVALDAGHYTVSVWGGGSGNAWMDICSGVGKNVHVHSDFTPNQAEDDSLLIEVELVLETEVFDLEIRVGVDAITEMRLSCVDIYPSVASEPPARQTCDLGSSNHRQPKAPAKNSQLS